MATYEVARRILVRKIGLKASALVEGLVSGPCKTRTAVEQAAGLSESGDSIAGLTARLLKLDKGAEGAAGTPE